MGSTTNLFRSDSVDHLGEQKRAMMSRLIASQTTVKDLAEVEADGDASFRLKPITLRRDSAEFEIHETPQGIEASIVVPFSGDQTLFGAAPGGPEVPLIYATVNG